MSAFRLTSSLRHAWRRPDRIIRGLLGLLLALQLLGPTCCTHASDHAGSSELAGLSRIVGHPLVLCHHGDPDHQAPADHHDCCGCGMCAVGGSGVPAAPTSIAMALPVGTSLVVFYAGPAHRVASVTHLGSASPRGPPLDV